ncbi:AAA domain-containing protein [Haloplasma contractile]|uniref:Superfamily i DNA helicase protein n=1 Tax=Haloplasma contractile SSD-17B TaxID=1033810 RepID=U2FFE7_9MOLU|nr:AAA domain-containing protein [Haloplasma contractile]ERJ11645.1 superfamily i DNA helicase protein [Haloplasma contractile SSD-17B]
MDQQLYTKLINLREQIKNKSVKNKFMRTSVTVCSDDTIKSIVDLMPKNVNEFKKIQAIDHAFIKKYAKRFLTEINHHIKTKYSYSRSNQKENEILQKLSNKLVNINQKNRLLYTNRLTKKTAFDLTQLGEKNVTKILDDFLSESTNTHVITKVNYEKNNSKALNEFNSIKQLYRTTETVRIEKGQELLYIGYPYVEGKLGSDFKIKAPLMLFPAQVDIVNNEYQLKLDKSRDIIYNSTIIIANNKFNNKNEIIDDDVALEINKKSYIKQAIDYFKRYNVSIKNQYHCFPEAFVETTSSTFPNYSDERLHIKGYCVLGSFPTYSNAIQRDYNEIVNNKVISKLVRNLFVGMNELNTESLKIQTKDEQQLVNDHNETAESELFYINELNYSQERVLSEIEKKDAVVIQGPPGTGKSQTITSLISQAVLKNKKVLIVSEKKTALDVIYNRLGKIANFVMYIDDSNNKDAFYKKLIASLELDETLVEEDNRILINAKAIDYEISRLNDLEKLLDTETRLESSLRHLYMNSKKLNLDNPDVRLLYKELNSSKRKQFTLVQLLRLRSVFQDNKLVERLLSYKDGKKYDSFYTHYQTDIKETDLYLSTKDLYEIPFYVRLYEQFGFITKYRLRKKTKGLNKKLKDLFINVGGKQKKKIKQLMFDDVERFLEALNAYPDYHFHKSVYDSMQTIEQKYFDYCFYLSRKLNLNFSDINEHLINVLTTIEIDEFESKYGKILITTERYPNIRERISELAKEKERLTFERLYNILQANIKSVYREQSNRLNELKRKCESKRRWSISKLIKEFNIELFESTYVWLLTPEAVSELLPLKETLFDLIIFDEASQMYIENAVPILYRGKKAIIAGDTKQLRPSKFGLGRIDYDDEGYDEYSGVLEEESLLDLAKHRYHEVMLTYHYRSKYEELIAFSNYGFYDGKLHVCPNPHKPLSQPIERIKVNGKWIGRQNEAEALEIVALLKKIFAERQNETIGIITFNATQKNLIMDKIEEECLYNNEFNNEIASERLRESSDQLFIKNIENVQGDERDIIIFSIGYAPNEYNRIVRQFGWLNSDSGENRLNVAISRAKRKIYIVTSIEPNELQVDDLKNKGPKLLRKYLEYTKAVSENDSYTMQKILYSLTNHLEMKVEDKKQTTQFEDSVYLALTNAGYSVEQHVGTGTHKVHLAIKDDNTDQFILGIELDDTLALTSTKERDYYRQKYLETNGWNIHRIWSSDWWRDQDKEVAKIESILNNR